MIPAALTNQLHSLQSVLVAFSGGVDSTFLLKAAIDTLGDNVLAVTATGPLYPAFEIQEARVIAAELQANHLVIESDNLSDPNIATNPEDRCYWCKKQVFGRLVSLAKEKGFQWVVDGSHRDDLGDYRPGMEAVKELNIRSPLQEAGLGKKEIRAYAKQLGLSTWDKPSYACLASRIPYGTPISTPLLRQVDRAETFLRHLGFCQLRVRHHGDTARIELLPSELQRLTRDDLRVQVVEAFKSFGYTYIALDLEGYRSGSLNESLTTENPENR